MISSLTLSCNHMTPQVTLWFFGTEAVMILGAQRFFNLFVGLTLNS